MIVYNPAFDIYHAIYRLLQLMYKVPEDQSIEIDRLRIWDFYLLFPNKVHEIHLKLDEKEIRQWRREYIRKTNNPYEIIPENRKVFEKLRPYQLSALNCIASYGIIDKSSLTKDRVKIINKQALTEFVTRINTLSDKDANVINMLVSYFLDINLYGVDGLKNRSNLIETKYDAE